MNSETSTANGNSGNTPETAPASVDGDTAASESPEQEAIKERQETTDPMPADTEAETAKQDDADSQETVSPGDDAMQETATTETMAETGAEDTDNKALSAKLDAVQAQLQGLEAEFQSKLKYDQHKEKIIDNLHHELQEYKNNLIQKLLRPVIMDVILAIDDVHKLLKHYNKQKEEEPEKLDPLKLLGLLNTIPEDLSDLLYRQGVEPFSGQETLFNPARQKAAKTIPVSEPEKDKQIAQSVRTGYEWEGKILRPELVDVYVYRK